MTCQGSFAQNWIADHFPGLTPGADYTIFPFPDIDPAYVNSAMGSGDLAIAFTDTTEVHSLVNFLITTDAAET